MQKILLWFIQNFLLIFFSEIPPFRDSSSDFFIDFSRISSKNFSLALLQESLHRFLRHSSMDSKISQEFFRRDVSRFFSRDFYRNSTFTNFFMDSFRKYSRNFFRDLFSEILLKNLPQVTPFHLFENSQNISRFFLWGYYRSFFRVCCINSSCDLFIILCRDVFFS